MIKEKKVNVDASDYRHSTREESGYDCWLRYTRIEDEATRIAYGAFASSIRVSAERSAIVNSAVTELRTAIERMLGRESDGTRGSIEIRRTDSPRIQEDEPEGAFHIECTEKPGQAGEAQQVQISAPSDIGLLYGTFALTRLMQTGIDLRRLKIFDRPHFALRMVDHWDNADGSIERGYAGQSFFFKDGRVAHDLSRVQDYARLLASLGINAVSVNNVNVTAREAELVSAAGLPDLARIADAFRPWGVRVFASIDYSSPISQGGLSTADPLDPKVERFWQKRTEEIYRAIPDFGGFLVKADSENRPGPHTYGRDHADGANVLARALEPCGGLVVWRCFVYNCHQDWRDRSTDRARAAFDTFVPLDGRFADNVVLRVKDGPMDFQVREPVSPLLGAMSATNMMLELQITQEYTGQQKHVCYLVPRWKEALDFDTHMALGPSRVLDLLAGPRRRHMGVAGVVNVGTDENWTGHHLAQANLYGFGRLAWNPLLSSDEITHEWVKQSFGTSSEVVTVVSTILSQSWETYERYTAPLGVGWMCNVGIHY